MTSVIVSKSDMPIIEIAFAEWGHFEYFFREIPGNQFDIDLVIDSERPQLLWYMGKFVGAKIEINHLASFLRKQEEDRKKAQTPTS